MIQKDVIEKIFDAVRIEEVVSDFVSLKRRGVNMIGLCPFHKEKTPSFFVSPSKNIFKCFGCGKGGNAVDFIMEHEKFSYPDALRYLAKKYHIEIAEQEQTAEEIASMNERESLMHVVAFAHTFFQEQLLNTDEGRSVGLSYLNERNIRTNIIKKFQLGYSPETWDALTKKALESGYKKEFLEKTGLSIFKEDGKSYDRFRGRILFPIHGISGRVIGFGGRIMDKDKSPAKYVNSPESEIYHKSSVLYGLFLARTEISRKDLCYLTEGYMDVISMHQAGIENVVASSGTSLTTDQIKLIKRFTPNITILYDGDAAGIKASFRGIDMILEEGMNVRVVLFPDGDDPDSYARKHTSDQVQQFLDDNTQDFITFKSNRLLKDTKNDPIQKSQVVVSIISSIALIPNQITRELYVRQCAEMMQMDETTVMNQLNQIRRRQFQEKKKREQPSDYVEPDIDNVLINPQNKQQLPSSEDDKKDLKERELARLLVLYGTKNLKYSFLDENAQMQEKIITVADCILNVLENEQMPYEDRPFIEQFDNQLYQQLIKLFSENRANGHILTEDELKNHPDDAIRKLVIDFLTTPYSVSDGWEKKRIFTKTEEDQLNFACDYALLNFQSNLVGKKLQQIELQLNQLTNADEQKQNLFLDQYVFFTEIKKTISGLLNRTEMVD